MDGSRFDALARMLVQAKSRRRLIALSLGSVFAVQAMPAAAKKKKKTTLCHQGQTLSVSKKAKKKHLAHGDTLGPCPSPPPPVSPPPAPLPPAPPCVPNCEGRVCGPTSCGNGSCGECGPCKNCEGGACFPKANGAPCGGPCEECQNGTCVPKPAKTSCGACRECQGTSCERTCTSSQECVHNVCEDLSGGCTVGVNFCASGQRVSCMANGAGGSCLATSTGAPFCYSELQCSLATQPICQSNADCVAMGFGAHAQCIPTCTFCGNTQPACARLAGE